MIRPTTLPPGGQRRRHVRVPLSADQARRAQFAVVSSTTGTVTPLADIQAVDISASAAPGCAPVRTIRQNQKTLRGYGSPAPNTSPRAQKCG